VVRWDNDARESDLPTKGIRVWTPRTSILELPLKGTSLTLGQSCRARDDYQTPVIDRDSGASPPLVTQGAL